MLSRGFLQFSRGVGIIVLCGLALLVAGDLSPLWLSILTSTIIVMVDLCAPVA